MHTGFITLHRKMLDWEWYDDTNAVRLFLHCLLKANWQDKKWQGNLIKRGSFITSIGKLAEDTSLTPKQTRRVLEKLEKTGELVTKRTNKFTLVTVAEYSEYQDKEVKRAIKGQSKGNQRDNKGQQLNNINNINKETKEGDDAKASPRKSKKGVRLEDDWELPEEWGNWAEKEGLSFDEICNQEQVFKDYWISQPAQKGVKLDWQATWRNWIRRHKEFMR